MGGRLELSEKAVYKEKKAPKSPPPKKAPIECDWKGCVHTDEKPGRMKIHVQSTHRDSKSELRCGSCGKPHVTKPLLDEHKKSCKY